MHKFNFPEIVCVCGCCVFVVLSFNTNPIYPTLSENFHFAFLWHFPSLKSGRKKKDFDPAQFTYSYVRVPLPIVHYLIIQKTLFMLYTQRTYVYLKYGVHTRRQKTEEREETKGSCTQRDSGKKTSWRIMIMDFHYFRLEKRK